MPNHMFWYTYTICRLDKIMIKNLKTLYYLHRNVHYYITKTFRTVCWRSLLNTVLGL